MADPDLIEGFFNELSGRGHDPLLDRVEGAGRFDVIDDDQSDSWTVTVKGGYVTVSRGGGDNVDWVMRADRRTFNQIIHGDDGSLAAYLSGSLEVLLHNPSTRFGLIARLFAGPPESRKQWVPDERWRGDAQR